VLGAAATTILVTALPIDTAAAAGAATVQLAPPQAQQLSGVELFQALGVLGDQLPGYKLPGGITEAETVRVELAPDGTAQRVVDDQRLVLQGVGDYIIREAGPALSVSGAGDETPVLNLGDVVWQGFSTGSRTLDASIELDPAVEAFHLPLRLGVAFHGTDGRPAALGSGGRAPGPGTVTLALTNDTVQSMALPTAGDVSARLIAGLLDRAGRDAATPYRLPSTRETFPTAIPVAAPASARRVELGVPLRLQGRLVWSASGAGTGRTVSVGIAQLLSGTSTVSLDVPAAGALRLDLTAVPALDPKTLEPPGAFTSWAAWAASNPPPAARRAALDRLVSTAFIGARASAFSPYLGSLLGADGSTSFRYGFGAPTAVRAALPPLRPRPVPITLAAVGVVLAGVAAVVVWRRS
jgi:hypothetical protein